MFPRLMRRTSRRGFDHFPRECSPAFCRRWCVEPFGDHIGDVRDPDRHERKNITMGRRLSCTDPDEMWPSSAERWLSCMTHQAILS